jgi:hypothetical protein
VGHPASPDALKQHYMLVGSDGGVFVYGGPYAGSTGDMSLNAPIVGAALTLSGQGYWLVAADGGIFTFGDAAFHGSAGGTPLNRRVVGMAATPRGGGSTGSIDLRRPVVAMASTPSGRGYWMVASDGEVFAFGDATYFGSPRLTDETAVAVAPMPGGGGYLVVTAYGALYGYGDATVWGSALPAATVVGLAVTATGLGYWCASADGAVFAFGDAQHEGSAADALLTRPIVAICGR